MTTPRTFGISNHRARLTRNDSHDASPTAHWRAVHLLVLSRFFPVPPAFFAVLCLRSNVATL